MPAIFNGGNVENSNACGIWDKTRDCLVPASRLELLPLYHSEIIPSEYLDVMGHMNVRWYMALFDKSIWNFFVSHGMDEAYFQKHHLGVFALKHVIHYFAEVKVGETVELRARLLGRSDKRFHFMIFMINKTTGRLAATLEALGTHADLKLRKAAPILPEVAEKFDARLKIDQQLDWKTPLSGAIKL
jgi:acyl-CoA thioester hydrolase